MDDQPSETKTQPPFSNGTAAPSFIEQLVDLVQTHVELFFLESQFECIQFVRRAVPLLIAVFLATLAFVLIQISIIDGLIHWGLPLWGACLLIAGVYGVVAAGLILYVGRRDARAGKPFQGSVDEFKRSRTWIHKRFF